MAFVDGSWATLSLMCVGTFENAHLYSSIPAQNGAFISVYTVDFPVHAAVDAEQQRHEAEVLAHCAADYSAEA
ncbi:uncharacterized protein SPSK_03815 [Sporothrix schenckii 1099-18]|uniref:Uncharacterized protein n=1 Tax=Sporothrix schenckii 1099-18 TaxID=1397361 RepID=A0A0F2LZC8_SPOSC|nr:uncharacterized protein SPSK_03815 [Sporothrix schenckii 1099-18]KJR82184.1 hypothetical protein SPSK_03815 [Sporothrix schenckii 1099-18]